MYTRIIISIFTPHGGCPEKCHFCDQTVSGGTPVSVSQITNTIWKHLDRVDSSKMVEVGFYGGTFTAMPKSLQLRYLSAVKPFIEEKKIHSIRISTRPDAIDEKWLTLLRDQFGVRTVELGVQSINIDVLKSLGRSHSVNNVVVAVGVIQKLSLQCGLHFMIGCPGEAIDEDKQTLGFILKLKPNFIRIHPLLVLKGTELEKQYNQGGFNPIDLETAVNRCANLTETLESQGISVIRLSLQPNELLGEALVAGPYHPAFGELVRARIWRNRIARRLSETIDLRNPASNNLKIWVGESHLSQVRGQKRQNISWLQDQFNLSSVHVGMLKGNVYAGHNSDGTEENFQIKLS